MPLPLKSPLLPMLAKGQKQLVLDVSELMRRGDESGHQHRVRSALNELLANQPLGWRIEPVYSGDAGVYRYARNFTMQLLGYPEALLLDDPVELTKGDVFLGLDLAVDSTPQRAEQFREWRNQGATESFATWEQSTQDLLAVIFSGDAPTAS